MSRILVVEDEAHIADGLRFNLEADGHTVQVASTGEAALARFDAAQTTFDLLVLDVMLPGLDGFAVAAHLRAAGAMLPILMLTARSRPADVLHGFEAGADDYLPKPFELSILLARIHGLLRRRRWNDAARDAVDKGTLAPPSETSSDVFSFAGRTLDFSAMELRAKGYVHRLTLMECDLLKYLVAHAGQPVSRRAILADVWGLSEATDTRAIDNFIVRLRRYIEDRPASPIFLQTVRGVGYRFVPGS
jgi:two-component system alkaline phosphatase synthesis response regulator PhoP